MTNISGGGEEYEIDFNEIINEIDAKIKLSEIKNEKKYVNETGDKIEYLHITGIPKNDMDAVNLKYVKNLENKLKLEIAEQIKTENDKFKIEYEKKLSQVKSDNEKKITQVKSDNEKKLTQVKSEYEKKLTQVKNDNENKLSQVKIEYEKKLTQVKNDNESEYEKIKTEIANHVKLFDLLNKNVTIFHGKVEKRFEEIIKKKLDKIAL